MTTTTSRFLVPELDGDEIPHAVNLVEELLLNFVRDDDPAIPGALSRGAEAFGQLWIAIDRATFRNLYAPDGRYEHEPLAVVTVPSSVVFAAGAAVAELARTRTGSSPRVVKEIVEYFTDLGWHHQLTTSPVETAARIHGLCDLTWGPDQGLLTEAIESHEPVDRVVLTADQEAAYLRMRDRFVAMWHDHSVLDRWQY